MVAGRKVKDRLAGGSARGELMGTNEWGAAFGGNDAGGLDGEFRGELREAAEGEP